MRTHTLFQSIGVDRADAHDSAVACLAELEAQTNARDREAYADAFHALNVARRLHCALPDDVSVIPQCGGTGYAAPWRVMIQVPAPWAPLPAFRACVHSSCAGDGAPRKWTVSCNRADWTRPRTYKSLDVTVEKVAAIVPTAPDPRAYLDRVRVLQTVLGQAAGVHQIESELHAELNAIQERCFDGDPEARDIDPCSFGPLIRFAIRKGCAAQLFGQTNVGDWIAVRDRLDQCEGRIGAMEHVVREAWESVHAVSRTVAKAWPVEHTLQRLVRYYEAPAARDSAGGAR